MCRLHGTTFHVYAYTINSVHNCSSTKYPKHALLVRNINSLEPMKIVNVLYKHCILMEC